MKILFFGTPEFAKGFLSALHADSDIEVIGIVTQPDKPVGRKKLLTPSPVKVFAAEHKIPVYQPEKKSDLLPLLKGELEEVIKGVDVFVVVAYGKILPQEVLDLPRLGTINVHPSKLPQYRGPSPMQAALVNQDEDTAVSIMLLDAEMDHGPILSQKRIVINPAETIHTLQEKAINLGAPLLIQALKAFHDGIITPSEQDHRRATYCGMLSREDGRINWQESAAQIEAKLRAYHPWPGLWTTWNNKRVKFSSLKSEPGSQEPGSVTVQGDHIFIGTGEGLLVTAELQLEGQQKTTISNISKGYPELDGAKFGT